jgi:hypothetical protein
LTRDAKVFGGDILTATDICVCSGADIGDASKVADVQDDLVVKAKALMKKLLEVLHLVLIGLSDILKGC